MLVTRQAFVFEVEMLELNVEEAMVAFEMYFVVEKTFVKETVDETAAWWEMQTVVEKLFLKTEAVGWRMKLNISVVQPGMKMILDFVQMEHEAVEDMEDEAVEESKN